MKSSFRLPALALVLLAFPAWGQEPSQSFCARLAPQLKMKLVPEEPKSTKLIWKADMASVGMYLFGGSTTIAMNAEPVDVTNAAEFVRLQRSCDGTRNGALCHLDGPLKFQMRTKRGEASAEMAAGEHADVRIRNTAIICSDR